MRRFLVARRCAALAASASALLVARPAGAWVSAYLEDADVAVAIERDGMATSVTTARYVVQAGRFREFRIHDVPLQAELDLGASWVESDKGNRFPIELDGRRTPDGTIRLRLGGGAFVPRGRATCRLALRENLVRSGRARAEGASAAIDWTPPVFPDGMGRMTATVTLAGDGPPVEFRIEESLLPVLEPKASGRTLTLSKFRPTQFYAMPVRFSVPAEALPIGEAAATVAADAEAGPPRVHGSTEPPRAGRADAMPLLLALPGLGLLLVLVRTWHAGRVAVPAGGRRSHLLLPALGAPLRWPAVAAGLATGSWLLLDGRVLAGLGLHAIAVLLAVPDRFRWIDRGPVGTGPWRPLAAPSPRTWRSLAAVARRSRRSVMDATGPVGFLLMLATLAAVAAWVWWLVWPDLRSAIVVSADALVLLLPPFLLAPQRALPPVLPAEAGLALDRVRRRLARRLRRTRTDVSFLVQDDPLGRPADLRMRLFRPDARVARSAELAVEWRLTSWGWCSTFAVLLRLPAGSCLCVDDASLVKGISCHLAPDLRAETWLLRAATPGAAATTVARAMETVERALAAP